MRHIVYRLLSRKRWRRRLVFWSGAIVVGVIAVLFAHLAEFADHAFRKISGDNKFLPLILTPLGLGLTVWLTYRYFPGSQGSGIPQSIAALNSEKIELRDRLLSIRVAIGKVFLSFMGLLSGASIGREGPTVHIGSAIMFNIGRYANFPRHDLERGLILAGGAAGISAAFNTPLAGIVFAIEEMSRSFDARTSGTILTTVILAGVVAMALQGNYSYFGQSSATFDIFKYWYVIPVAAVVGGVLGGLFANGLVRGSELVAPYLKYHPVTVAAVCGLLLALLGLLSGGSTYGTGYIEAQHIIANSASDDLLYPIYKMFSTAISYFSGIPGGIFAPSLAVGAGVGANLSLLFSPEVAAAVVLLGMTAYFTGVVQTPITAFVIIMEMTDSQTLILPLMTTALIAYGASNVVCKRPIYRTLAKNFR